MLLRSCLSAILGSGILLLGALPAAAQLPSNATLQGAYSFRYLGVNTGITLPAALSAQGTLTFDGKGGFTVTGTLYKNSGAGKDQSSNLSSSGTYEVTSNAMFFMDNVFAGNDAFNHPSRFFGGVGVGNIVVGSSTEYTFSDLFVCLPQAAVSDNVSNATLSGDYFTASMEFPASNFSQVRGTFFKTTADGKGGLGTVTVKGYAANVSATDQQTQISNGATYSVTANGTGTLTLPASSGTNLLSGAKSLYVARDGSFFVAGGSSNYDIVVGIKALSGTGNRTPLKGLYFMSQLVDDSTVSGGGFHSSAGSVNEIGDPEALEFIHERFNDPAYGAYDWYYNGKYTFNTDGSYSDSSQSAAAGAGGNAAIYAGGGSYFALWVSVKSLPMNGTGVFLNPQGVINSASYIPFTAQLSPGEFISLYGSGLSSQTAQAQTLPLPSTLGDVQVQITATKSDGSSYTDNLALYTVSPGLIQGIIPYSLPDPTKLSSSSATLKVVLNSGTASNPVPLFVGTTSPGLFTLTQNGLGDAAILHADYSVVTPQNPARPGETVQLFLTGMGPVSPAIAAGAAASSDANTLNKATIKIDELDVDGYPATVIYNGLAPGLAGLYQLNFTIPSGVTRGKSVYIDIFTPDAESLQATIPISK